MAIRYLNHTLITYPLSETARKHELQTITYILQDNDYYNQQPNIIQNQTNEEDHQNKKNNTDNPKKNWALFTCSHKKTKTITKLKKLGTIYMIPQKDQNNHKTSKTVKHKYSLQNHQHHTEHFKYAAKT
jgi:hypothetical protein